MVRTALFKVGAVGPADALGRFVETTFCGASSVPRAMELDQSFSLGPGGVVHLCKTSRFACGATDLLHRGVLHVDAFWVRSLGDITEVWARHNLLNALSFEPGPRTDGTDSRPLGRVASGLAVGNQREEAAPGRKSKRRDVQMAARVLDNISKKRRRGRSSSDSYSERSLFRKGPPLERTPAGWRPAR